MSKAARTSKTDLATVTAKFWQHIEQRCMIKGVKVLEREYYGIRPEDYIQMIVTVSGKPQVVSCPVSQMWRNYCSNLGINADLFIASQQAVGAGLLKSSNRKGKDTENPGKTRSYGVQFWTPSNTIYLGKKQTGNTEAITPSAVMDAFLGSEPVIETPAAE